jgi:hypothetical protein
MALPQYDWQQEDRVPGRTGHQQSRIRAQHHVAERIERRQPRQRNANLCSSLLRMRFDRRDAPRRMSGAKRKLSREFGPASVPPSRLFFTIRLFFSRGEWIRTTDP